MVVGTEDIEVVVCEPCKHFPLALVEELHIFFVITFLVEEAGVASKRPLFYVFVISDADFPPPSILILRKLLKGHEV